MKYKYKLEYKGIQLENGISSHEILSSVPPILSLFNGERWKPTHLIIHYQNNQIMSRLDHEDLEEAFNYFLDYRYDARHVLNPNTDEKYTVHIETCEHDVICSHPWTYEFKAQQNSGQIMLHVYVKAC